MTINDGDSYFSVSNFEHYFRISKMISSSELVPKSYKDRAHDVLIAMELGRSLGLAPLQAVQNIAVINGKPALYGDAVLAVCSGHPDFENIEEQPIHGNQNEVVGYSCTVKRKGRSPVTQVFTIENAKAAGLWGKMGPWKSYPERMLQMRARGFALRDSFADALGGVKIAEEIQDYPREIKDITPRNNIDSDLRALIDKNKAESKNGQEREPSADKG